jgi:hypothetical protein
VDAPANKNRSENKRNGWLFLGFVLFLGVFKFTYHEFWKDEWQAWFVATDTPTLQSLWKLLPVEGHPALWFLILRFSHALVSVVAPALPPEYLIQTVHLALTIVASWIFFTKFRFHYLLKIALALSYFFFFEYGVINRGYILVILFLFWTVPYLDKPRLHIPALSLLLFLLTQTEIYGVFAAASVALVIIWKIYQEEHTLFSRHQLAIAAALASGLLIFVWSVFPDAEMHQPGNGTGGSGIAGAFVSLYANTLAIGIDPPTAGTLPVFSVLLSLLMICAIVIVLRKNRIWMISFFLFSFAFLIFSAFIYHGGPRQWGLHFIFLVVVMNFAGIDSKDLIQRSAIILLLALIVPAQLIHSLKIIGKEKKYLFSNSIEAGRYIRRNIPPDVPVLGINKAYCTPVIGYSGHKFYSLPEKELFSYSIFREKLYLPSLQDIRNFYVSRGGGEMYVVSYKPLPYDMLKDLELQMEFNKPNIREENYYLYKVKGK